MLAIGRELHSLVDVIVRVYVDMVKDVALSERLIYGDNEKDEVNSKISMICYTCGDTTRGTPVSEIELISQRAMFTFCSPVESLVDHRYIAQLCIQHIV